MHYFYYKHCSRWGPWGSKYLSEEFFIDLASEEHRDQIVLFQAYEKKDTNPMRSVIEIIFLLSDIIFIVDIIPDRLSLTFLPPV